MLIKHRRIVTVFDSSLSCSVSVQTAPSIQASDAARLPAHPYVPVLLRPPGAANTLTYPHSSLVLGTTHSPAFLIRPWLLPFHLHGWSPLPCPTVDAECPRTLGPQPPLPDLPALWAHLLQSHLLVMEVLEAFTWRSWRPFRLNTAKVAFLSHTRSSPAFPILVHNTITQHRDKKKSRAHPSWCSYLHPARSGHPSNPASTADANPPVPSISVINTLAHTTVVSDPRPLAHRRGRPVLSLRSLLSTAAELTFATHTFPHFAFPSSILCTCCNTQSLPWRTKPLHPRGPAQVSSIVLCRSFVLTPATLIASYSLTHRVRSYHRAFANAVSGREAPPPTCGSFLPFTSQPDSRPQRHFTI